ncbi:Acyl-CoA dehydrogenase, C-terminal domain [Sulfitobacter brevis]|uniref:Acyl-CoA dehydrogenase, C-terminal domain n=1 Tax=Sulfitobacter brevis TaxID=74348 RepID=A0A1I1X916_9RHOB|nr:Acyl-CoA dehydrogenase, C-terminal domain [Sulfitobacter brevis]
MKDQTTSTSPWMTGEHRMLADMTAAFIDTEWALEFDKSRKHCQMDRDTSQQAAVLGLTQLQNTRFQPAETKTRTSVARAFLDSCIADNQRGALTVEKATMQKSWLTDTQGEVPDICLQMHGGYGFMQEYAVGEMGADARVQRICGGTIEIMNELIGRAH